MNINILPQNVTNLVKVGIFHFGSEDLTTFLQTSTLLAYNWIEDDAEPEKRERVIQAINEVLQTDPFLSFDALTLLMKNLLLLDARWESLPPSIQDLLSHLFSSLSPANIASVKEL
jgi:hypothetical protein